MADDQDITFDDASENLDDSVVAEEHLGDAVKKLKGKLKEAETKAKEYLDQLQRAKADFVNMRKRDEEDKAEFVKFARSGLIEDLFPVLDALESAVSHGDRGIEQTLNLFKKILKQHGLEELDPKGETFDPRLHEAVGAVETDKKEEDHRIVEVMQKGYILSGKIIRPAKVKITNYNG